jgi:hypothetical protein
MQVERRFGVFCFNLPGSRETLSTNTALAISTDRRSSYFALAPRSNNRPPDLHQGRVEYVFVLLQPDLNLSLEQSEIAACAPGVRLLFIYLGARIKYHRGTTRAKY